MLLIDTAARYAPDRIGERACDVFGQPQCFAHIANSAARTIADNGCDNGCTIGGIAPVDILHDLFAPLMLEIDIDIRRFFALGGNETFKQKVDLSWVYAGNTKAEADHGIGRRAAPLTQNFLGARILHDVIDG